MAWDEVKPKSIDELSKKLRELRDSRYACRGQSNAKWKHLTPTLTRAIAFRQKVIREKSVDEDDPHKRALMLEATLVERFGKFAFENLSHTERSMLDNIYLTLSLMQHYGTPTRLLDWTLSPWVAAYFAGGADPKHIGVIWAFSMKAVVDQASKLFRDKFVAMAKATADRSLRRWIEATREPFDGVDVLHLFRDNLRMTAQQSIHTIAGTFDKPHDVLIEEMLPTNQRVKIIITAKLKAELMQTLAGMNIDRYSLFGGAEGLGRKLKDEVHWGERMGLSNVTAPLFQRWSVD